MVLSEEFGDWLEQLGMASAQEAVQDIFDPALAVSLVRVALSKVGGVFGTGLLVLLAVVFMLLEAPSLAAKLKTAFHLTQSSSSATSTCREAARCSSRTEQH